MSERKPILLVGATGLVGKRVMELAAARPELPLVALTRREAPMPEGARMEMLVADPAGWPEAVAAIAPSGVICALGTTMRKAGSREAFRAVDHALVVGLARAARDAGVSNFVLVSSAGADRQARTFYLRTKAEVEAEVAALRFHRLDILRPGLLRGPRGGDRRVLERLAIIASPLTDLALHGHNARFRSIDAGRVAAAALQCAREKAQGRYAHDNASIERQAWRLEGTA